MKITTLSLFFVWLATASDPSWSQTRFASRPAWTGPPEQTKLLQEEVSIPMKRWGGRPIIFAKINGTGPYSFILDTGSSVTAIVDKEIIQELGIETGEEAAIPGMSGKKATIESLDFEGLEMTGVRAVASDVGKFLGREKTTPIGILGIRVMAGCLFTYDFPGNRYRARFGELPETGAEIVEYDDQGAISFRLDVAGTMVTAHMDTGSPGSLLLPTSYEEKIPLTGPSVPSSQIRTPMGSASTRTATIDGLLKIGNRDFKNVKVGFADLPQMVARNYGNVGSSLLKFFAVTFDQKNTRLRFHSPRQE